MTTNTQHIPEPSVMSKLPVKLALLFAVTFLAALLTMLIYSVFIWSMENRALEMNLPAQPAVGDIDPKIEGDLAKVLVFEAQPDDLVIRDPFNDRGGLSAFTQNAGFTGSTFSPRVVSSGGQPGSTTGNTILVPGASSSNSGGRSRTTGVGGGAGATVGNSGATPLPRPDTKARLEAAFNRLGYGQYGEPASTLFSVDDLIPVGVVDGGNGAEEVMFYSIAADRTLSFAVGTRFYDAWLRDIRPDGVVFGFDDKYFSTRLKSWGRSIKTGTRQAYSVNEDVKGPAARENSAIAGGSN